MMIGTTFDMSFDPAITIGTEGHSITIGSFSLHANQEFPASYHGKKASLIFVGEICLKFASYKHRKDVDYFSFC